MRTVTRLTECSIHLVEESLVGLLEGKVVMVTGAARGQGRAHAVMSAREGADVIAIDIAEQIATVPYAMSTPDELAQTVRQVEDLDRRALSAQVDARSQEQLDAVVAEGIATFGKIDCIVINHGIFFMVPFWEMTQTQWDDMIDTNLAGVWKSAKAVAPHMIERGKGSIVVIASQNAIRPAVNYAHYCAAKAGAVHLMKAMALELAPHGVRCNAILPGVIWSKMIDHQNGWDFVSGHAGATQEEALGVGHHVTALRNTTFMSPDEIAKTAVYLNSELASKVTGIGIPVDGGSLLLNGYNHNPVRG